jgi:hypothetical protein
MPVIPVNKEMDEKGKIGKGGLRRRLALVPKQVSPTFSVRESMLRSKFSAILANFRRIKLAFF